jgi:hypothetical protein
MVSPYDSQVCSEVESEKRHIDYLYDKERFKNILLASQQAQ